MNKTGPAEPVATNRPEAKRFAELLRHHRSAAGLSQEALAERAGMSASAISALERGTRQAPWRETVSLIADALSLSSQNRATLERAAETGRARKQRSATSDSDAASNLPIPFSSFIGRSEDLATITALLKKHRLVTITGGAGVGKTRVALEVAGAHLPGLREEVYFVDLGAISDGSFITAKIASAIRSSSGEGRDELGTVLSALRAKKLMLVVDNCEHVLRAAASTIQQILQTCPDVAVITTSRERLGIPGEVVFRLPPLAFPADNPKSIEAALSYAAVNLFVQRALEVEPRFTFSDERLLIVGEISRRLGGVALAIELAAARLPMLGLSGLRTRLNERFDVLSQRGGDSPPRQRTLESAIAWSAELLDDSERRLLSRLSVFANGWTLAGAQAVCDEHPPEKLALVERLASLVEKSLVIADIAFEPPRYRLFESTREYADSMLDNDERLRCRRSLAQWSAARIELWRELQFTTPRLHWMHEISEESDNVRASLAWASGPDGDYLLAARIASGPSSIAGRSVVERAVERIDEVTEPAIAAHLWRKLAATYTGEEKAAAAEHAMTLFEQIGDRLFLAVSNLTLAIACARTGHFERSHRAVERARTIYDQDGQTESLRYLFLLTDLSDIYQAQGLVAEQRATVSKALTLAVALSDDYLVVRLRSSLAELEFLAGDVLLATQLAEDVLLSARSMRSIRDCMTALCNLAGFYLAADDVSKARDAAREALEVGRGREERIVVSAIGHLAAISALNGQAVRAARLLGFVEAWFRREGNRRTVAELRHHEKFLSGLRKHLSDDSIAMLGAEGGRLTEFKAIAEALETVVVA